MKCSRTVVALAFLVPGWAVASAPARGAASDPTLYTLSSPPSEFEWGCFAPCECPVMVRAPLTGTFLLRPSSSDPVYATYDVYNVRWDFPESSRSGTITGSGTYQRGGEVAMTQQLTLDLSFDGAPPQHFDSGAVPIHAPFPEIDARISLHSEYCHDSVLVVSAKPLGVTETGSPGRDLRLNLSPNPFSGSVAIECALPGDGPVRLQVFDVAGRRVRGLIHGQWMPRGAFTRSWDGRLEGGAAAPAGLYVVQLDALSVTLRHTLTKLR